MNIKQLGEDLPALQTFWRLYRLNAAPWHVRVRGERPQASEVTFERKK
jgi:hypothetical protein